MGSEFVSRVRVAVVVVAGVLLVALVGAGSASAVAPWWSLTSSAVPTYLAPGGEGTIVLKAINLSDGEVSGSVSPVTVSDTLPAGLTATAITGQAGLLGLRGGMECSLAPQLSCTWTGSSLPPYEPVEVRISVRVTGAGGVNEGSIVGGGGASSSVRTPVVVSASPTPFGVESYEFAAYNEEGSLDTQAGSHPFQLVTNFALNTKLEGIHEAPAEMPKDFHVNLPAGVTGNASSLPQCTEAQFLAQVSIADECPANTVIGVAVVTIEEPDGFPLLTLPVPVFNLVPAVGEPARFGFKVVNVFVTVDPSLRTGGDYGVTASSPNTSETAAVLSSDVILWGVPGDPRHDPSRGWGCIDGGFFSGVLGIPCNPLGQVQPAPFIRLATSCGPLRSSVEADSWAEPENVLSLPASGSQSLEGCDRLGFNPSLAVSSDTTQGATPAGVDVDVKLPQEGGETAGGLAVSDLKATSVTFPNGMVVNPAAANGLQACSEEQIGLHDAQPVSCPAASKLGTVEATTPTLSRPLSGALYVAQQGSNPFGALLAAYLVVEEPGVGVLIKIAGHLALDPVSGQVTATFEGIPQQPVSDVHVHLFGGPRAALVTPAACGAYTTTSQLSPWSGQPAAEPSSFFQIASGAGGAPCASSQPFAPGFVAGTTNNQAGAFSTFTMSLSRQDGEQAVGGIGVQAPAGLLGVLKGVALCGEPQAAQGTCGAGSLIGHVTATAGAGSDPVAVTGQVFLTGPYKGAPFGLSIVVPAAVGPFNLGNVVVRAAIGIDPHTAQISVTSDPLPTILQGIPLQIRNIDVSIDRSGFLFNPTNCEPLAVTGAISSSQGASVPVSSRFQAANCAALPFDPSFKVSTQAKTSKANGASLDVKVGSGAGQANIGSVAVTLPTQLPSRLSTIQQACPAATFAANPASCPAGSNIGTAVANTPVLANPVTGPAYLVSHGGAAFPDLVLILQGEGVKLELVGNIDIKKSITSSTFASVPDAPIDSFELSLPEGPHSGLTTALPAKARGNLCGTSLTMPTTITGQNGAVIKQNTKIAVTGCPMAKPKKKAKAHGHAKGKPKKGGKRGA
jgi:hypothetical protein